MPTATQPSSEPDRRRAELQVARRELRATLEDLLADARAIAAATGDSPDDEHDAEGSTVGYERARVAALLQRTERAVADVDTALARLDDGTYGRCGSCGRAIPDERLDALPGTTRCVTCATPGTGRTGGMR